MGSSQIKLTKCSLRRGCLIPDGESFVLSLPEAIKKFVPMGSVIGKRNMINIRRGQYLGLRLVNGQPNNFLITNPTNDGDIRWLLNRNPEVEFSIQEVYLVDEVIKERDITDLPTIGMAGNNG